MICYENRNGMLLAYDTESKRFILAQPEPWEETDDAGNTWVRDSVSPEEIKDAIATEGITEVYVHQTGKPWLQGTLAYSKPKDRADEFRRQAMQASRNKGVWIAVPIARIADGSDWADIYQ